MGSGEFQGHATHSEFSTRYFTTEATEYFDHRSGEGTGIFSPQSHKGHKEKLWLAVVNIADIVLLAETAQYFFTTEGTEGTESSFDAGRWDCWINALSGQVRVFSTTKPQRAQRKALVGSGEFQGHATHSEFSTGYFTTEATEFSCLIDEVFCRLNSPFPGCAGITRKEDEPLARPYR